MPRIYTRKSEQEKRRRLRRNMTNAEVLLWMQLKNRQLLGYRFLRQYSVDRYVVDFYCPALKLAIEVDGDTHFSEEAVKYDRQRQRYIEGFGIRFLRFPNTDIYQSLDGVLQKIADVAEGPGSARSPARKGRSSRGGRSVS